MPPSVTLWGAHLLPTGHFSGSAIRLLTLARERSVWTKPAGLLHCPGEPCMVILDLNSLRQFPRSSILKISGADMLPSQFQIRSRSLAELSQPMCGSSHNNDKGACSSYWADLLGFNCASEAGRCTMHQNGGRCD